jgi:four helix bundle protein
VRRRHVTFRFQKFPVYKDAKEFVKVIMNITSGLTKPAQRELASHMRDSALSLTLNIAEGSDKGSDRDFNRYIRMSLGSLNEVVAALDVAIENNFIAEETYDSVYAQAENLARQLGGFSRTLARK